MNTPKESNNQFKSLMKKRLSNILRSLANCLYQPSKGEIDIPQQEGYTVGKIGLSVTYNKRDIKKYMKTYNVSQREAKREIIKTIKEEIASSVASKITKLVDYKIENSSSKECLVSGQVLAYIPIHDKEESCSKA